MKIVVSTGYEELGNYWGSWFTAKQIGGSERIVLELSRELAALGHSVTLRLPYHSEPFGWSGVQVVGYDHGAIHADLAFCFDQYGRFDDAPNRVLVACRSDRPRHSDFSKLVFLSKTHARHCGFPDSPTVGGGVRLSDYKEVRRRQPGRVICTSSPDRCAAAFSIGAQFRIRLHLQACSGPAAISGDDQGRPHRTSEDSQSSHLPVGPASPK